jgi:hypothetical protein
MFNLYEIFQNAQGGQAVDNLARQFNISPEQAEASIKAFMPALSSGFMTKAADPVGFSSLFGAMGDGQHQAAFNDPNVAQTAETAQKGSDILAQIFGSQNAAAEMAQKMSAATGLSPELLAQMFPVIASMVLGGVTTSLQNQGFGGILGQITNAFQQGGAGGLGSIFSQMLGGGQAPAGAPNQTTPAQGGMGAILGNLIGSFFGRQNGSPQAPVSGFPSMPGFDANNLQAGFEALNKMFQPGVPPTPPADKNLENEIGNIMGGKR